MKQFHQALRKDRWAEWSLILNQFARHPLATATVAPSSRYRAKAMAEALNLANAGSVVELGPGTGGLTQAVLPALRAGCRYLAVERNNALLRFWEQRFQGRRIRCGSVADLEAICQSEEMGGVDCIVSGLPWPSFSPVLQDRGLEQVISVLKPGGQMVTFGYHFGLMMTSGQRFHRLVRSKFSKVERLAWEWRNVPPAFVLRCTR